MTKETSDTRSRHMQRIMKRGQTSQVERHIKRDRKNKVESELREKDVLSIIKRPWLSKFKGSPSEKIKEEENFPFTCISLHVC